MHNIKSTEFVESNQLTIPLDKRAQRETGNLDVGIHYSNF